TGETTLHKLLLSFTKVRVTRVVIGNGPTVYIPVSVAVTTGAPASLVMSRVGSEPSTVTCTSTVKFCASQSVTTVYVASAGLQSRQPTCQAHSVWDPLEQLTEPSELFSM